MQQPNSVAGKWVAKLALATYVAVSMATAATLMTTVLPPRTARATVGVAAEIAVKGARRMCVQPIISITQSKMDGT